MSSTDWNKVADWYDQLVGESGSEYHQHVVLPGALRLLAPQTGQRIADLACGQGVLCRLLAAQGVHATGIDAAPELIRAARERDRAAATPSALAIDYHVGDIRQPTPLPPSTFDAAACLLAIQNIHPIAPVFAGAATLLKPMGKLVLVMMHPCFRGPRQTGWGWDEKQNIQYRRVERYLLPRKTPIVTHPGKHTGKDAGAYTWSFHKPIEAYVRALRNAGLLIDALEEWPSHKKSDSGPRAAAENSAREEIPMFLAIRAVKVPATSTPLQTP
jgi:ubiquinone/menaquinone biosynthesis C-methylase UbiE